MKGLVFLCGHSAPAEHCANAKHLHNALRGIAAEKSKCNAFALFRQQEDIVRIPFPSVLCYNS